MRVSVTSSGAVLQRASGAVLSGPDCSCTCGGTLPDCGPAGCSNFLQLCTGLWAASVAMSGSSNVAKSGISYLDYPAYVLHGGGGEPWTGTGAPPSSSTWPEPHGIIIDESFSMSIPSERPSPANPWGDTSYTSIGRFKDYSFPTTAGGGSSATYTFDAVAQNGISVSFAENNLLAVTFYLYNGGSPPTWSNSGALSPSFTGDYGHRTEYTTSHTYTPVDSFGTLVAFTHAWSVTGAASINRVYGYTDPYAAVYVYGDTNPNTFHYTYWNGSSAGGVALVAESSYGIGTGGGSTPFSGTSWGICGSTTAHTGHYTTTFDDATVSTSNGSISVAVTPTAQTNTAASGPRKVTITGTLYCYVNPYTNNPTSYDAYHVERDGIPSDVGEGEELPLSVTPVSFTATLLQMSIQQGAAIGGVSACDAYAARYVGPGTLDNGGGGVNTFTIANVYLTRVGPALWKLTLGDSLYPSSEGAVLLKVSDGVDPTTVSEVEQFPMPLKMVPDTVSDGTIAYVTVHYEPGDGNGTDEYFTGNGLAIVEAALVSGDPTYACDTQCAQSDVPQIILNVSAPGISVEGVLADQVTAGVAAWAYTSDDGQIQTTVEWNATTKRYEVVAYKLVSGTFVAQKTFTLRCQLGNPYPMIGDYTPTTSGGTASVDVP